MSEPRAYTAEEIRDLMLSHFAVTAAYWARLPDADETTGRTMTTLDRCNGVVFSILSCLDGSSSLPAADIVFQPHEDDKEFHIANGENWIDPGTTISDMLHERWHNFEQK